jgi:hypothetical protein
MLVMVDPETGAIHRYNQDGLEVTYDENGNVVFKDKRGKIVKDLDGETF